MTPLDNVINQTTSVSSTGNALTGNGSLTGSSISTSDAALVTTSTAAAGDSCNFEATLNQNNVNDTNDNKFVANNSADAANFIIQN